jgi:methanogenic corrinoid protein MtbC1
MVSMLAAMHGWGVLYLGTNLPADEIAFAVADTHAELLMLSVTSLPAQDAKRELASIMGAIPDHVRVLVGGRAAGAVSASRVEIVQDLAEAELLLSR